MPCSNSSRPHQQFFTAHSCARPIWSAGAKLPLFRHANRLRHRTFALCTTPDNHLNFVLKTCAPNLTEPHRPLAAPYFSAFPTNRHFRRPSQKCCCQRLLFTFPQIHSHHHNNKGVRLISNWELLLSLMIVDEKQFGYTPGAAEPFTPAFPQAQLHPGLYSWPESE